MFVDVDPKGEILKWQTRTVTIIVTVVIAAVTTRQAVTGVSQACTKLDRSCKVRNVDNITVLVRMPGVCEIDCGIMTSSRRHVVQCGVRCYAIYKTAHTLNRRNCLQIISFTQREILVTWIWRCFSHRQQTVAWNLVYAFFLLDIWNWNVSSCNSVSTVRETDWPRACTSVCAPTGNSMRWYQCICAATLCQ
jgi:hypothetical protein